MKYRRIQLLGMGILSSSISLLTGAGCTGNVPGGIRLAQQEEIFSSLQNVNTKLDMLFVMDSSGSMANEQAKLRSGFVSFANRYMQPGWDIRLAVITTDTYLAHPSFTNFINGSTAGTANYLSNYVNGTTAGGVTGRASYTNNPNPPWNSGLFAWDGSVSKWRVRASGLTARDMRPNWGPNWAKLLDVDPYTGKGNHDGPPAVLCMEKSPSSGGGALTSASRCETRDNVSRASPVVNTGPSHCISPVGTESAVSQCVNTGLNDSVHSGKSIITTFGVPAAQLIDDFIVNVTVGIDGSGTEEGINSLLQLLADNEAANSTTKFFRKDSLRVIIFISDEEDQSIVYPTDGTQVNPNSYFSTNATTCQKTVDGYTYSISQCANPAIAYPNPGAAQPIPVVKSTLDSFFRGLDGNPTGNPNYFITTITALTATTVQSSGDQGTRYLELGQAVGNGSLELEITSNDYSPLLDAIGQVIVQKKGVFTLKREPTGQEEMVVTVIHQGGSRTIVTADKYSVAGKTLTITDTNTVLSLAETDQISISYQPRTVYQ